MGYPSADQIAAFHRDGFLVVVGFGRRLRTALHAIDGGAVYPVDNWLQRGPELPLRSFA